MILDPTRGLMPPAPRTLLLAVVACARLTEADRPLIDAYLRQRRREMAAYEAAHPFAARQGVSEQGSARPGKTGPVQARLDAA
jgi:hypothetical protein